MERDERLAILKGLPKVELHRHLEGSLRPATLLELGRRYGLDLPLDRLASLTPFFSTQPDEPRTLANFLTKFRSDWYRSYADVERVAAEAVADAVAEGIVHLELRFSPEHLTRLSGLQVQGVMQAVVESARAAAEEGEISVRFLITFARERYVHDFWVHIIDVAARMSEQGVAGVDLAGDEFGHANAEYERIFRRVQDTGVLGSTIHAGEGTSAESVATAVERLCARRIGHGLRAVDDPRVIRLLVQRGVTLEMCPTSNYQTGCVDDLQSHPLPALDQAGVAVTLNSDDPTIQRSNLNHDYDIAITRWGYTLDDLLRLERHAVRAAFLTEPDRVALLARVERGYQTSVDQGL